MGGELIAKLKKWYAAVRELFEERTLEKLHDGSVSRVHALAHLAVMTVKSFMRNRCLVRATALSYTTLLALVPLLAVVVSVTHSFLQEKGSTEELIRNLVHAAAPQLQLFSQGQETGGQEADEVVVRTPEGPAVTNAAELAASSAEEPGVANGEAVVIEDAEKLVVDKILSFAERFDAATVGFSGLVGMIAVALMLISTIEGTFNDIWGIRRGRSWFQRVVTYWATISLGPVIMVMAFVLAKKNQFNDGFYFDALPFLLISLGFGLLYKLMPNTQVQWRAALMGGVVGGCLWLLMNLLNAASLGRVVQMSKVYGPLAIIPIFLIGLYFSWLIVLFGAQVSYTIQNRKSYLQERRAATVSQPDREYLALRVMTRIAHQFSLGDKRPSVSDLAEHLGVSSRLITLVVDPLLDAHLLAEVSDEESSYLPGRPLNEITCHDILLALRTGTSPNMGGNEGPGGDSVQDAFNRIQAAEKKIAAAITLQELVSHPEGSGKIRPWPEKAAPPAL